MNTRKATRITAAVGIGALTLTACGNGEDSEPVEQDAGGAPEVAEEAFVGGGTFSHAVYPAVDSIIPMTATQPPERQVITYAYESLIYTTDEGEYLPWLAESWEIGEDGQSVTYELKEGITFHDGTEFDAEVAAANITYHADPENASTQGDALPEGVSAEGDGLTLEVTTEGTDPFLDIIVGNIEMVAEAGLANPSTLEEASNGTSLYELTGVQPDLFVFERRDDYEWGPQGLTSDSPGLPDELEISVVTEEGTRANLLLSGELNAAAISGSDRDRVDEEGFDYAGVINPIGQMLFNEREDRPTHDPLVREALVLGFNHDDAAEVVSSGRPMEMTSWIAEAPFICYNEEPVWERPETDMGRAAELLDEAGWELNGELREKDGEPLEITFLYDAGSDAHASAAELVAQDWATLGIDTQLSGLDSAGWSEYLHETFDYDTGWIQVGVGGPTTADRFYGGASPEEGGLNFMGTDSEGYADHASQAKAASSPDEACEHWDDAEQVIVEDFHTFLLTSTMRPTYMTDSLFEVTDYIQAPSIRMTE